jgi:hypothetical protein
LFRIAFPRDENGAKNLSRNPKKWSCNIAYQALGGKIKRGHRIENRKTLEIRNGLKK